MGGQTLWKSACLPAASCCVQRPAVTAQGSELIARAGSSMGWMECSEVDFSEVLCTVRQQQSTAGTYCILFLEKKRKRKKETQRRGEKRDYYYCDPPSLSLGSFRFVLLSSLQPLACISLLLLFPLDNSGGNGSLAQDINRKSRRMNSSQVQSCTLTRSCFV